MNQQAIIEKTWEVVDELKQLAVYQEMKRALKELMEHNQTKPLFDQFTFTKQAFEEVSKYSKHHPDYAKVSQAFQQAKIALFSTSQYQTYISFKKEFDAILSEFTDQINQRFEGITFEANHSCQTR